MKNIALTAISALLLFSCGGKTEEKKEEDNGGFTVTRKKETETVAETVQEVPVDLENKGIGPITEVKFDAAIDAALASKGEEIYNTYCTACHMLEGDMIGPGLSVCTKEEALNGL